MCASEAESGRRNYAGDTGHRRDTGHGTRNTGHGTRDMGHGTPDTGHGTRDRTWDIYIYIYIHINVLIAPIRPWILGPWAGPQRAPWAPKGPVGIRL